MFTFSFILTHTGAKVSTPPAPETTYSMIDFDTRRLQPTSVFVALTLGQTDGHLYIEEAIRQGATAILASNPKKVDALLQTKATFFFVEDTLHAFQALAKAYRQQLGIPVIAITGSNGKTTSKDILASLLATKLRVHATHKNFNNHLGVPLTLLQADLSHDVIVLEMGMNHAGELDRLGAISEPNYVVITNIGESHIEHLGSRENIAHAKGELLPHLQKGGIAFLPGDSEFCDLLSEKTNEKKVFFQMGTEQNNPYQNGMIHPERWDWENDKESIFAHDVDVRDGFTFFEYGYRLGDVVERYHIPLYGEHNVLNSLSAVYLAKELGFTEINVLDGFEQLKISPMRFERVQGKNGVTMINDAYNASPTSMKKSSETFLDTFVSKRRVLVLGDMYELGDDSVLWHQSVGEYLNEQIDKVEFLVTIGEDSRVLSGLFKGRSRHFSSKKEAADFLHYFLHDDFVFFFKASRGMQLETVVQELT